MHEGLDVLASAAPDLPQVLAEARARGVPPLVLDGTLIATDRVAPRPAPRTGRRPHATSQNPRPRRSRTRLAAHHRKITKVLTNASLRELTDGFAK